VGLAWSRDVRVLIEWLDTSSHWLSSDSVNSVFCVSVSLARVSDSLLSLLSLLYLLSQLSLQIGRNISVVTRWSRPVCQ
jgi:hypothetical protein